MIVIRFFTDAGSGLALMNPWASCGKLSFSYRGGDPVKAQDTAGVEVGDVVVIEEHRVGEARRLGEILEVLGESARQHYRVRWDDGRESIFYPSNDAVIRRPTRGKQKA